MSYCIETVSDEPIIIYTLQNDFFGPAERERAEHAVCAALDDQNKPTFVIFNIQTSVNFNDLMDGTDSGDTRLKPISDHPNLWESVTIAHPPAARAAAHGLDAEVFGTVKTPAFPTVTEAINYIRSQYGAAQATHIA